MTGDRPSYLLPAGFGDTLPPLAEHEAAIVERLMACFARWGYRRVKPPLMEFENSLLAGPGAAMSAHTFRLMDPVSQRMMGLRADMTPQVARIAASRLAQAPRPLRLSYAGQVLRVKGEQMLPERQLGQVGVELIGDGNPAADIEVLLLAVEALNAIGIADLVVDLNLPALASAILAGMPGMTHERQRAIVAALDRKDAAGLAECAGREAPILTELMTLAGTVETALPRLIALDLPAPAAMLRAGLADIVAGIRQAAPDLRLNLDVSDHRGFEYHTGPAFSLIGGARPVEFGRGGRYVNHAGEMATGVSFYLDILRAASPAAAAPPRIFLPLGTPNRIGIRLRAEGWVTVSGLRAVADIRAEAGRQGCAHLWAGDAVLPVA